MSYIAKEDVENYLLQEIDPTFDSTIESWIAAAEAHINGLTGRTFEADSVASARLYEGGGKQRLIIDDCIEVTEVEIGDDYGDSFADVDAADYTLLPLNGFSLEQLLLMSRRATIKLLKSTIAH